jgi:hypothetical protein
MAFSGDSSYDDSRCREIEEHKRRKGKQIAIDEGININKS